MVPKTYTPSGYNTPHPVNDWVYVRNLARSAIKGDSINPILADGENLLAGVHRAAANDLMEHMGHGRLIDAEELGWQDDEDLTNAAIDSDFELIDQLWDR